MVAAGLVVVRPFFGELAHTPKHAHEAPWTMWMGPLVLGGLSLVLGLFGDILAEPLVAASMTAILAEPAHADLSLIELISHVNIVLILSMLTILLGAGLYYDEQRRGWLRKVGSITSISWGPEHWYNRIFDLKQGAVITLAKWQTARLQSGKLRIYLRIILTTTTGLLGAALVNHMARQGMVFPDMQPQSWGLLVGTGTLAAIAIAASIFLVRCERILSAVAAIGIAGYAVAIVFILFSAPDLAITQFSIETLMVILFVLVFYRLQSGTQLRNDELTRESGSERMFDGIIAVALGAMATLVMLVVTGVGPLDSALKPYFLENSIPEAKGHNVVNVILVDFRGFDTMGELMVLGLAALGVVALLKLRAHSAREEE
jgi:multicomponent Na+:H+ antiporter subunit A